MPKNSHRRKNNPIDGEKYPSHGKIYAKLHKFCHRLKKTHEFRTILSIAAKIFMNLAEFCYRWEKTCNSSLLRFLVSYLPLFASLCVPSRLKNKKTLCALCPLWLKKHFLAFLQKAPHWLLIEIVTFYRIWAEYLFLY
jgi:hypothetical protein